MSKRRRAPCRSGLRRRRRGRIARRCRHDLLSFNLRDLLRRELLCLDLLDCLASRLLGRGLRDRWLPGSGILGGASRGRRSCNLGVGSNRLLLLFDPRRSCAGCCSAARRRNAGGWLFLNARRGFTSPARLDSHYRRCRIGHPLCRRRGEARILLILVRWRRLQGHPGDTEAEIEALRDVVLCLLLRLLRIRACPLLDGPTGCLSKVLFSRRRRCGGVCLRHRAPARTAREPALLPAEGEVQVHAASSQT
mmetsp:Transcript_20361/g.43443  ORF Transcript_20361/g.43443 Transcript_20361/m.43443 type:complete len:250 (+) Transcript_20361:935-1684(+)